ncbi:hypothetical protein V8E53_009087 [Lactarius tabidus]
MRASILSTLILVAASAVTSILSAPITVHGISDESVLVAANARTTPLVLEQQTLAAGSNLPQPSFRKDAGDGGVLIRYSGESVRNCVGASQRQSMPLSAVGILLHCIVAWSCHRFKISLLQKSDATD